MKKLKIYKGFIKVNYCDWYPISSIKYISLRDKFNTFETDIIFEDGQKLTVEGSIIRTINELEKAKKENDDID